MARDLSSELVGGLALHADLAIPASDGEPHQLLACLVPLIPAPRAHQVRYHGVLAPCAGWRDRVVPAGPHAPTIEGVGELIDSDLHDNDDLPSVAGIYVFYEVSERPIYVGQGADIKARTRTHREKVETLLIRFLSRRASWRGGRPA
jgi:hypothetical protein